LPGFKTDQEHFSVVHHIDLPLNSTVHAFVSADFFVRALSSLSDIASLLRVGPSAVITERWGGCREPWCITAGVGESFQSTPSSSRKALFSHEASSSSSHGRGRRRRRGRRLSRHGDEGPATNKHRSGEPMVMREEGSQLLARYSSHTSQSAHHRSNTEPAGSMRAGFGGLDAGSSDRTKRIKRARDRYLDTWHAIQKSCCQFNPTCCSYLSDEEQLITGLL
jgi:hypothetical protein